MKKIGLSLLVLLLAFTFSVWAGGEQESSENPVFEVSSNVTEEGQVELLGKLFQRFVDEYNAENGTNYSLKFVSGQGMDIINTRMSSNNKPDIFSIDSPADSNEFADSGLLLDLTEFAEQYKWHETIFDWAYSLAKVDGNVMALPFGYEGMVIWYNKEIMKELGLDAKSIDTLPEFETAMKKASEADYIPVMLGSQDWPWAQEWYLSILYSYTGRDRVKKTIEGVEGYAWTDDEFAETVALYKSWHDKGYLADGRSYVLTSDDAINLFTNDRALFKLEGTWAPYWMMPLEETDQNKIGVMLHPAINKLEEPHMPLAVGNMWCASSDTKHPELAAYLLDRLLDQNIQSEFLDVGYDLAPMKINESEFEGLIPVVEEMWNVVNGALADGSFGYTTWAFYPPETRVYLYEGIVNVLEDKITIDKYLSEMQRLNQKELEQGFNPVIPAAK